MLRNMSTSCLFSTHFQRLKATNTMIDAAHSVVLATVLFDHHNLISAI